MDIKWQQTSANIWFGIFDNVRVRVYKDKDKLWYINLPDNQVVTKLNLKEAKYFTEQYMTEKL